ncbi:MAG: hypothetical protein AB7L91_04785 [Dehalococcoidia bacterium]
MSDRRPRPLTTDREHVALGRIGEREFRGVVERRELRLGPLRVGRVRPQSVDVFQPGQGHRPVRIDAPSDPYLRALRWTLVMVVGAVAVRVLARRRHTR